MDKRVPTLLQRQTSLRHGVLRLLRTAVALHFAGRHASAANARGLARGKRDELYALRGRLR